MPTRGGFKDGGVRVCWGFHALLGAEPHKSQSVQNTLVMLCARVVARISFIFFSSPSGRRFLTSARQQAHVTPTANVRGAKKRRLFIRSCVKMFTGKKANPGRLASQNDVGMWMMSLKKNVTLEPVEEQFLQKI